MVNLALIKRDAADLAKIWAVVTGLMLLSVGWAAWSYGHDWNSERGMLAGILPDGFRMALGILPENETLMGVIGGCLYGSIFRLLPLVYSACAANRLMAAKIADGTMVYLLSTPNARSSIAFTQAFALVTGLLSMFLAVFIGGGFGCMMMWRDEFSPGLFFMMNFGCLSLHVCMAGIGFFISSISDDNRTSLTFCVGIFLLCALLWMMSNLGGILEFAKYATVFSLFSVSALLEGGVMQVPGCVLLLLIGGGFCGLGIFLFTTRDIPA